VLRKAGEDYLGRLCEKRNIHTAKENSNILHTMKRRKANWIGYILRGNCLLKYFIEEKRGEDKSEDRTRKKT
jgi:hypothetical protein